MDDLREKAQRAIDLLSSIPSTRCETSSSEHQPPQGASVKFGNQPPQGARQRVGQSCSHAVDALCSIRQRLGHSYRSAEVTAEQKSNFAPYSHQSKKPSKLQSWTLRVFCLSNRNAIRVPNTVRESEALMAAGLGEVFIPNINCFWNEFKDVLVSAFPKLNGSGGFDLLRCIPNTKDLEIISLAIAQSPKLLKSVVAVGESSFIRYSKTCNWISNSWLQPRSKRSASNVKWSPMQDLRKHIQTCGFQSLKTTFDSSSGFDFEDQSLRPPNMPCINISSDEDESEGNDRHKTECDRDKTEYDRDETEYVMLEHAIKLSTTDPISEPGLRTNTTNMSSIVHMLSRNVESEEFVMPVRREHMLEDALRSLKRSTFSPSLTLNFLGEAAEDGGGPRREFWALLSKEIGSSLFEGVGGCWVLMHNAVGLQGKKFYYVGQLMAMSLVQEGSGFPYIAPPVYEYLCGAELSTIEVIVDDVPNFEVKALIEEV